MAQTALAFAPVITVIDGKPSTTSNEVALLFGKRHDHIIEKIDSLIAQTHSDFNAPNFRAVEYTDAKGEKRPAYRITRDGFTLLAMGFTGKRALQFKLAYIAAFNRMEAQLNQQPRLDAADAPAMAAARRVTRDYFAAYRKAVDTGSAPADLDNIPAQALHGLIAKAVMDQRMLLSFNPDTGQMQCSLLADTDQVTSWPKLVRNIANGDCARTSAELLDMATACMQRLQQRSNQAV